MPTPKVATCSYCGTRAALVLGGKVQHELACSSCGAPLHDLKQMPGSRGKDHLKSKSRYGSHDGKEMPRKKDRKKKKKSLGQRVFSEIWDVLEDVLD